MNYIKLVDGVPQNYTIQQLKNSMPNTSFPLSMSDESLAEYGMHKVATLSMPEYNNLTQQAILAEPELVDGVWTRDWQVVDLDEARAALNIREARNNLLAETDWQAVQDRTMSQAEIDYRQALRDITNQSTFPGSVVWPTKPE